MNEKIIEFNTKKQIKILFLGGIVIVFCLFILYNMIFVAPKIKIFYVIGMLLISSTATYYLILALKSIFSKDKRGLILNSNGIYFKGTSNGSKIGQINWTDIKSLQTGKIYGSNFVTLKLFNAEKYIQNLDIDLKSKEYIINNGVVITNDELSINFEEMKILITKYYNESKG